MEQGYEITLANIRRTALEQANINSLYIPLQGKHTTNLEEEPFDLAEKIGSFFVFDDTSKHDPKVILLMGDTGSGKSMFSQQLYQQLWKDYRQRDAIPLWIPLPELQNPFEGAVEEVLQKYECSESQIAEMKATEKFIFVVDGYDELHQFQNCYVTNKWHQWNAKVLITCRSQALYYQKDPDKYFMPFYGEKRLPLLFRKLYLAPFSKEQISVYIKKYQLLNAENEIFEEDFAKISGLTELITTPFFLYLAVEVLPEILVSQVADEKMLQAKLYDVFIEQWFARQISKLQAAGLLKESEQNTKAQFWGYCKKLAKKMHEKQVSVIPYSGQQVGGRLFGKQSNNIWEPFFDEKTEVLRSACPLRRVGEHHYGFMHASMIEYFATKAMCEEISNSTVIASEAQRSKQIANESGPLCIAGDDPQPRGGLHERVFALERQTIRFLADRIIMNEVFKQQLLDILEGSKTNEHYAIGAANSITALVRAGVTFNDAELTGIKISGADITGGYFDSANLSGADLRKVNLSRIWLRNARLVGCQMQEVQFGEYPYFKSRQKVISMIYRSERNLLVTASSNTVYLWDIANGKCIKEFTVGHTRAICSVSLSADGQTLASASSDWTVQTWKVSSNQSVVLEGHHSDVNSVHLSSNGQWVASGSSDHMVRIWDIVSGQTVILKGHASNVYSVYLSTNGEKVASGSQDKTVRVWDIATEQCVILKGHEDAVQSVALSENNETVASGSLDFKVRVWNIASGKSKILIGHEGWVTCVHLSGDAKTVISGSVDRTVRVWDVENGHAKVFRGHKDTITSVYLSSDARTLASASEDKTVRVWEISASQELLQGHTAAVNSVSLSSDGLTGASGSSDSTLQIWGIASGQGRLLGKHEKEVSSVHISSDGNTLVSGGFDAKVRLWNIDSRESVIMEGHEKDVWCVRLTNDGQRLLSGSSDNTMRVWDVTTRHSVNLSHKNTVSCVDVSMEGLTAVSGNWDNKVSIWNLRHPQVQVFQGHTESVMSVYLSLDGRLVVSGSQDKTVRVWEIASSKSVVLRGHKKWVMSVYLCADGQTVLSGSRDKTLRTWDILTQSQRSIIHLNSEVNSLAFHEASRRMLVGLADSSVQLWVSLNERMDRWRLAWSSNPSLSLHLSQCDFTQSKGLTDRDERLMMQRGAINSAKAVNNDDETIETVNLISLKPPQFVNDELIPPPLPEEKISQKLTPPPQAANISKLSAVFKKKESQPEQKEKKGVFSKLKLFSRNSKGDNKKSGDSKDQSAHSASKK